jgi:hypothetical protein
MPCFSAVGVPSVMPSLIKAIANFGLHFSHSVLIHVFILSMERELHL